MRLPRRGSGGGSSQRICGELSGAQPSFAGVQYGAAHGRGHASPPCGLYSGSHRAEPGTVHQGFHETGVKAAGFVGLGRKRTEWNAWLEREKAALTEIAQAHEFEIISLGGGRPHMDLPQYREAAQRLEAVQEQVSAAEHDIAELEKQKNALQGTVRRLQAAEKVRVDLEAIQPERTLTGAVRGVTVEQVEDLKATAIRGAAAEYDVLELKKENRQLHSQMPSIRERLKEAEERKKLEQENMRLKSYAAVLEDELDKERNFIDKLVEGLNDALDFLEKHLPEPLHSLLRSCRSW